MSNYPKELKLLRRHAFAVIKAMPEMEKAYDTLTGIALDSALNEIGVRFGLSQAN